MKITKILEGCHDSVYLLDVPVRRTYRQRKKNSCTNRLTLGLTKYEFPKSLHFF